MWILQLGSACPSSAMPASVAWVPLILSICRLVIPLRCTSPASVIWGLPRASFCRFVSPLRSTSPASKIYSFMKKLTLTTFLCLFRSINEGTIATTCASGELIFSIFLAFTRFVRRLIQERTKTGLEAARSRGRDAGRSKVRAQKTKVVLAKKLYADKILEIDDICKTWRFSRSTFYRYVRM